ncbi:MAG: helix-turn-helix transcriptional regulator [Xanthobacteraceae bacterium]|nr:helix-turn-helix transcriptional regulator [Xanthobacteraceae bacterium]
MEAAIVSAVRRPHAAIEDVLRLERAALAAKTRAARAVLGLSQRRFAELIGLTQKSVHRIEHGAVHPSMRTIVRIEKFWHEHGVYFEETANSGFRLVVDAAVLRLFPLERD